MMKEHLLLFTLTTIVTFSKSADATRVRLRSGTMNSLRTQRYIKLGESHFAWPQNRMIERINVPSRQSRMPLDCKCEQLGVGGVLSAAEAGIIQISPNAEKGLLNLRFQKGLMKLFRVGVKSGGCSGMSYTMDIVGSDAVEADDTVVEYNGFKCIIDPKSLLYLFGMTLDYNDDLIGGGFKFFNPNAKDTCGCGSSFGV